ncbi:MAG: hypothetical protein L0312_29030, partial [Acidobacteria bacterium]|nr:hypothetical protein [Acidobacteriota bacterium]
MTRQIKQPEMRDEQLRWVTPGRLGFLASLLLFSVMAAAAHAGVVVNDDVRISPESPVVQQSASATNQQTEIRELEPGKPIERELAGGRAHSYQVTLASNQYLYVVVDQRGIDVVVTLFGPDDKKLIEVDSPNGAQGPEPVKVVSEAAGSYRIEVKSLEKDVAAGRYMVKIEELRVATAQDKSRIAAERAFAEG